MQRRYIFSIINKFTLFNYNPKLICFKSGNFSNPNFNCAVNFSTMEDKNNGSQKQPLKKVDLGKECSEISRTSSEFSRKKDDDSIPPFNKSKTEGSAYNSKFSSFEDDWKKLQNMSQIQKRNEYTCKKFILKQDIETWSETGKIIREPRHKESDREFIGKYDVSPEINQKVATFVGDITALEIDCIVNAANRSLLGGGGVDGAIHRAAGPSLVKQCRTLNGCDIGDAKLTYGYKLPSTYVMHTVGPMNSNPKDLKACYQRSMEVAMNEDLRSIAFPCIATGVYGFPNNKAAKIALTTIRGVLEENPDKFDLVIFCLFMPEDVRLYHKYMQLVYPLN